MTTDFLILQTAPADHVLRLTLNRPDKRNAISADLRHELLNLLDAADANPAVHVVIIDGAGSCFSSGYDLRGELRDERDVDNAGDAQDWPAAATASWLRIGQLGVPVIAQIHGYALAGGTELAAACDLVYIADEAHIAHPVIPLFGPADFNYHPWLVGPRNAMEMALTGEKLSGIEAVQVGYANRSWPEADLTAAVLKRAITIASSPRDVSRINKATVRAGMAAMGVDHTIKAMVDWRRKANANLASSSAEKVFDAVKSNPPTRPQD